MSEIGKQMGLCPWPAVGAEGAQPRRQLNPVCFWRAQCVRERDLGLHLAANNSWPTGGAILPDE